MEVGKSRKALTEEKKSEGTWGDGGTKKKRPEAKRGNLRRKKKKVAEGGIYGTARKGTGVIPRRMQMDAGRPEKKRASGGGKF